MEELTTSEYWNAVHVRQVKSKPGLRAEAKRILYRTLGARGADYFRRYVDYLLWNVILERHLPKERGLQALEIGSAPGWFLVRLAQRFGYSVFGIEYTPHGAAMNRELFARHGLDPSHVYHQDFFAGDFHRDHAGQFDVVISRGFIEHFDDPRSVLEKHLNLLAPGGTLVVSVPNKRGINRLLTAVFHPRALKLHNLAIMRRRVYERLFEFPGLERRCCTYIGTFSFDQFNTPPGSPARVLLAAGRLVQYPLNALFRLVAPNGGLESGFTSPHLVYVGKKER